MRMKHWKKILVGISIVLVILGAIITFMGIRMVNFNLRELETGKWYQFYHFEI